jgi:3D (Asp-Asp-Asp) domain-containing protein
LGRLRLKGLFALGASALLLGYLVPTAQAVSGPSIAVPAGHPRLVAGSLLTADGSAPATSSGRDVLTATIIDSTGLSVRTGGGSLQRRVLSTDLMDALTELGIAPQEADLLSVAMPGEPLAGVPIAPGTLIREGMLVNLVRITHRREVATATVHFTTRQETDTAALAGTQVVLDPGADGVRTIVSDVTLADGAATGRRVISDDVTTPPRERVVRVGTRSVLPEDPSYGVTYTLFSKNVTSYCLTGTTATGTQAGPGSIAVDPTVIKLGSHLYVEGYGFGWAVDTGGGIHGDAVDIWKTCDAAIAWGRRAVTVYVLDH